MKRYLLLLFIVASLLSAKSRIGFYTMLHEEGVKESQWIGVALADLIAENIQAGDQAEVIGSELLFAESVKKDLKITDYATTASFEKLKTQLNLDYLVTGTYKHQPDRSLNLTILIHDFKENKTTPLAVQGYSNDIPTIISYVMGRVAKSLNLTTNANDLLDYRLKDSMIPTEAFANYYQGINLMRSNDYLSASVVFEEAYKNHLDNMKIKERYDQTIEYLYGDGIYALDLFNADQATTSEFKKQYLTGKKIASGFSAQITGSKIELNGSYYSLDLDLAVKIDPKTLQMINEAIKVFQPAAKTKIKNDVYNPNAKPELGNEMEKLFERNIGNSQFLINCFDKNGNLISTDKKSMKIAFDFRYKDDVGYTEAISYKKIFTKTGEQKAQITLLNLTRDTIKKIDRIAITIR